MKKVYNLLFIINVILGLFIFVNYFFLYKYSNFSIFISIVLSLIYIACAYFYNNKKNKRIELIDILFVSISCLLMMTLFIVSVLFQLEINSIYCLLYFNILVLLPHTLMIVYNLLR